MSRFTRKFSRPNVDLVFSGTWGDARLGLNVRDLFETTYRGPEGSDFHLRTRLELQLDYDLEWGHLSLDHDVSPQAGFGVMRGRRETRLALDAPVSRRLNLGASYLAIQHDHDDDAVGLHISYHLPEGFHLRLSGLFASRNELGGAFEIQLPLF